MNKFERLSRAEMKNVMGGYPPTCNIQCKVLIDMHLGTYFYANSQVPNCDADTRTNTCLGEEVVYCTCGGPPA
jgi:hypothetical protein